MSETIPGTVSKHFRDRALAICDSIKPDFEVRETMASEFIKHYADTWRRGIRNNLSTEQAEEAAFASLPEPEVFGKQLRDPWWYRTIFYQRCRPHRCVILMLLGFYVEWLRGITSYAQSSINDAHPGFYFSILSPSVGALLLLGVALTKTEWSRQHPQLRAALVGALAMALLLIIGDGASNIYTWLVQLGIPWRGNTIAMFIIASTPPLAVLAVFSFISEVFGWPEQQLQRHKPLLPI